MIFRPIRISELEKDVEFKKEIFQSSKEELLTSAKQQFHPSRLLKASPKTWLGMGLGAAGVGTAFFSVIRFMLKNKKKGPGNEADTSWGSDMMRWGLINMTKTALPLVVLVGQYWLKKHLSDRDA